MTTVTMQELTEATRADMLLLHNLAMDDFPLFPGEFTTDFFQKENGLETTEEAWHMLRKLVRRGYAIKSRKEGKYTYWKYTEKYLEVKKAQTDGNKTSEEVV